MKPFVWLILVMACVQCTTIAQTSSHLDSVKADNCTDASKFNIHAENAYSWIDIKVNGKWQSFDLIEDDIASFEYDCYRQELNGTGSKELVIQWSNSIYGTGGGITQKGIQIWDVDSAIKLLDEITFCGEEAFGRRDVKAYLVHCQKQIEIQGKQIKVGERKCETAFNETDEAQDPTTNCELTTLEEGEYFFANGRLKKK